MPSAVVSNETVPAAEREIAVSGEPVAVAVLDQVYAKPLPTTCPTALRIIALATALAQNTGPSGDVLTEKPLVVAPVKLMAGVVHVCEENVCGWVNTFARPTDVTALQEPETH